MRHVPSVLVYARRSDEVLVMHRNKEPNLGLWVAPGGKVEIGESPYDAAQREMLEETGLTVEQLQFRGFCTEVSPRPDWQWLLFIFVTGAFHGDLHSDRREGDLAWVTMEAYLHELLIPRADVIFAPRVLAEDGDFFQAKFIYDDDLKLTEWVEY